MALDINKVLGETQEYGGRRLVLPESYYPMQLAIGEVKTTDLKTNQDGEIIGGGTPEINVIGSVFEGPFEGSDVKARLYPTPGKAGGGFGLFIGATSAVTGQRANVVEALKKHGIVLPSQGALNEKDYRVLAREAIRDGFLNLDPAKRLAVVLEAFRFAEWDGKKAIVKLIVETSYFHVVGDTKTQLRDVKGGMSAKQQYEEYFNNEGPDSVVSYDDNRWNGYFALDSAEKGLGFVRAVEFAKQERARQAMIAAGVL